MGGKMAEKTFVSARLFAPTDLSFDELASCIRWLRDYPAYAWLERRWQAGWLRSDAMWCCCLLLQWI